MNKHIPKQGNSGSFMDRLMHYITLNDHDYASKIKGASPEQIKQYCKLASLESEGINFPTVYLDYLRTIGVNNGGLLKHRHIDLNIEGIIEDYEEWLVSEPESLNSTLPIIGTYSIGDEISLNMDSLSTNPKVVDTSCGEIMEEISISFEYFMLQAAMFYVESIRYSEGIWASNSPVSAKKHLPFDDENKQSVSKEIGVLAQKLGLNMVWCSEARHRIFSSEKMSLFTEIGQHNRVMIYVFSKEDTTQFAQISDYFETTLGATGGKFTVIDGVPTDTKQKY